MLFRSEGAAAGGFNEYSIESFQEHLERHLRRALVEALRQPIEPAGTKPSAREGRSTPAWNGSPFPGLLPFDAGHASIFFGRDYEVNALTRKIKASRRGFVVVVGASGSGKSSLVAAGLLPRLRTPISDGGVAWKIGTTTPAQLTRARRVDPKGAFAAALSEAVNGHVGDWAVSEALDTSVDAAMALLADHAPDGVLEIGRAHV